MVKSESIRASNAQGARIRGFVAVFVGGTGGIGEATTKELFRRTVFPRIYIIGRSEDRATRIIQELHRINPDGKAFFIHCDVSLLRNVDTLCADLRAKEPKINALFLTTGYMTLQGRTETEEGLDRRMCVNYYARMRFVLKLLPLLSAASNAGELARVTSVLAAGSEGDVRVDDLDLRKNFTLHASLAHCTVMTDFMVEELARRYPAISFMHSYPGTVKTGIANQLTGPIRLAVKVMYAVMTPWILNVQESGERHFFQLTSMCYPARKWQGTSARGDAEMPGIPCAADLDVMEGSDGTQGSGGYLLDWDSKPAGDEAILRKYREMGMRERVWEHTMQMFAQAEEKMRYKDETNGRLAKVYGKRGAESEAEGSGRPKPPAMGMETGWGGEMDYGIHPRDRGDSPVPDPIGWRAG